MSFPGFPGGSGGRAWRALAWGPPALSKVEAVSRPPLVPPRTLSWGRCSGDGGRGGGTPALLAERGQRHCWEAPSPHNWVLPKDVLHLPASGSFSCWCLCLDSSYPRLSILACGKLHRPSGKSPPPTTSKALFNVCVRLPAREPFQPSIDTHQEHPSAPPTHQPTGPKVSCGGRIVLLGT